MYDAPRKGSKLDGFGTFLDSMRRNEQQQQTTPTTSNQSSPPDIEQAKARIMHALKPEPSLTTETLLAVSGQPLEVVLEALLKLLDKGWIAQIGDQDNKRYGLTPVGREQANLI